MTRKLVQNLSGVFLDPGLVMVSKLCQVFNTIFVSSHAYVMICTQRTRSDPSNRRLNEHGTSDTAKFATSNYVGCEQCVDRSPRSRCSRHVGPRLGMSRIDQCSGLLVDSYSYILDRLQSVLNSTTRLVLNISKFSFRSIPDAIGDELHCLLIRRRIDFKISVNSSYLLGVPSPNPKSSPRKSPKTKKNKKYIKFAPQICGSPRTQIIEFTLLQDRPDGRALHGWCCAGVSDGAVYLIITTHTAQPSVDSVSGQLLVVTSLFRGFDFIGPLLSQAPNLELSPARD